MLLDNATGEDYDESTELLLDFISGIYKKIAFCFYERYSREDMEKISLFELCVCHA